jgi:hypothetical protein
VNLSPEELETVRGLVREVLGGMGPELRPNGSGPAATPHPAGSPLGAYPHLNGTTRAETVAIRTDGDLAGFVLRLLHLFENPKHREDVRSGRLRFQLNTPPSRGSYQPAHRIEKGAVTEKAVREAARSGARLVLGPAAVLTPLARDRARADGVTIDKEGA